MSVAFVKFHLSRSRRVNYDFCHQLSAAETSFSRQDQQQCYARVRFSTVIDIGSASFKYDMRRLNEILEFPKAWYRRTLVRRLFLGELKTTKFESVDDQEPKVSSSIPAPGVSTSGRRNSVAPDSKGWIGKNNGAFMGKRWWFFAVHFKALEVHMNMGNVMGNVEWNSKDFRSEGRLSIGSTGHKKPLLFFGFELFKIGGQSWVCGRFH